MLNKIKEMKCSELLPFLTMVNIDTKIKLEDLEYNSELKYNDLLLDCSLNENKEVYINVEKIIDDVVFGSYDMFLLVQSKKEYIDDLTISKDFGEIKDLMETSLKMFSEFEDIFKKIILNTKFEKAATRQIQKYELEKELKLQIELENYEDCEKIKNNIKEI